MTRTYPTTIVDLGSDAWTLRYPIIVVVEERDGEAIASWPEIEAFGSGEIAAEAINDLKDEIVSLFLDLGPTPDDQLGALPIKWKRALHRIAEKA